MRVSYAHRGERVQEKEIVGYCCLIFNHFEMPIFLFELETVAR